MRMSYCFWSVLSGLLLSLSSVSAQTYLPGATKAKARVYVKLPANAKLFFDGAATSSTGSFRRYVTPPLELNKPYYYVIKVVLPGAGKPVVDDKKPEGDPTDPGPVDPKDGDTPEADPTDPGPVPPEGKSVGSGPETDPKDPGPQDPVTPGATTTPGVAIKRVKVQAGQITNVVFSPSDFQK